MRRGFKLLLATVVVAGVVAGVASAGVTQNDVNQTIPWSDFIPCANGGAGEDVSGTIDLHILMTTTVNGNSVSGKYHFQPQGSDLTGSVTGDAYKATGVSQGTFKGSLQNGQFTATDVNNYRLIGHGPGNNLLIHEVDHITVNANGDVTVTFEKPSVDCK
jgi:hypothetical protein